MSYKIAGKILYPRKISNIYAARLPSSVDAMLTLLDKLRVIEATGVLGVDLSWLNGNYQRALFHQVRKSSVTRLRELSEARRRAALVCFLWQSYRDAVDQVVDMFDKLLTRAHTQALNELGEQLCRQRQTIQVSLTVFRSLSRRCADRLPIATPIAAERSRSETLSEEGANCFRVHPEVTAHLSEPELRSRIRLGLLKVEHPFAS
jgi:hypothetical protein